MIKLSKAKQYHNLTGIDELDNLDLIRLTGGGLIEIIGKKGTGKTQTLLSICANKSLANKKIAYIDCSGSFRPETIEQIILSTNEKGNVNPKNILRNIIYYRSYSFDDLNNFIKKIKIIDIDCMVFDDLFQLFFYKFKDNLRLELRKIIRDLAVFGLSRKIEIFFTNTIIEREIPNTLEKYYYEFFYHEIIRYVHIKILLKKENNKTPIEMTIIHPTSNIKKNQNI